MLAAFMERDRAFRKARQAGVQGEVDDIFVGVDQAATSSTSDAAGQLLG